LQLNPIVHYVSTGHLQQVWKHLFNISKVNEPLTPSNYNRFVGEKSLK